MAKSKNGPQDQSELRLTRDNLCGPYQRSIAPHYFERQTCQRLEMTVSNAVRFTTTIEW